jgi:diaminohydroxyphosphoribosylaminopyrimidine deaminase/5-amino-6-(5-phosphoribosylamino)uracil reductase
LDGGSFKQRVLGLGLGHVGQIRPTPQKCTSETNTLTPLPHDEHFLRRALELARKGSALTSPNPRVGAVLVKEGTTLGEGFHVYENWKHAEILALEQARGSAHGATLYLNLEPCSHQGRTGPCADALIAAGIRRVVCSMQDPNPQVAGQGFAKLRAAGMEVEIGLLQSEAMQLNEAFAKYIRRKTPLVTLKCAMTLDGKIAPHAPSASSQDAFSPDSSSQGATRTEWITSEVARADVQQLRHQSDAILTGIGTILADDPLLTDRTAEPRRRPLMRVVLDSQLRLPPTSRLVQSAREDVLIFTRSADPSRKSELETMGVRVEQLPPSSGEQLDLAAVLRRLGELQITSLILEGGSHLNTAALHDGIVDKVMLYIAPKLFGQAALPFTEALQSPLNLSRTTIRQVGEDLAVEGYFKDPYQD